MRSYYLLASWLVVVSSHVSMRGDQYLYNKICLLGVFIIARCSIIQILTATYHYIRQSNCGQTGRSTDMQRGRWGCRDYHTTCREVVQIQGSSQYMQRGRWGIQGSSQWCMQRGRWGYREIITVVHVERQVGMSISSQ